MVPGSRHTPLLFLPGETFGLLPFLPGGVFDIMPLFAGRNLPCVAVLQRAESSVRCRALPGETFGFCRPPPSLSRSADTSVNGANAGSRTFPQFPWKTLWVVRTGSGWYTLSRRYCQDFRITGNPAIQQSGNPALLKQSLPGTGIRTITGKDGYYHEEN